MGNQFNTRLAASPSYAGEVTVRSLPVQPDGTTPLVVNWAAVGDADLQASDPANANKTISGYTVYRSTDGNTFTSIGDVERNVRRDADGGYQFTDSAPSTARNTGTASGPITTRRSAEPRATSTCRRQTSRGASQL